MLLVIGAGIVGLACAEELSRRGHSVRVLERKAPGGEASWAAGGMLAADYESEGPGPFADFAATSRALWPGLAERLVAGFHDVGFRQEGTLCIAHDDAELARLKTHLAWLGPAKRRIEWLDATAARQHEPALGTVAGAALLPDDGIVNNRAVLFALMTLLRTRSNVEITSGGEARLWIEAGTLRGVIVDGEKIAGDTVINAAGAWAGEVAENLPRFLPVRGQMAQFPRPTNSLVRTVRWENGYAIPRGQQIVIGSTIEPASGFDKRTTPEAIESMTAQARKALPALVSAPTHAWAGLRPMSADGLPVIGPSQPFPNLLYAAGLYRNGILLTAATARAIGDLVDGKTPEFPIDAFNPARPSLTGAGAILLNGAARVIAPSTTVGSLLAELALKKQGVAVAVNEEVVRRGDWDSTRLNDRDRVEIIHAVGGG